MRPKTNTQPTAPRRRSRPISQADICKLTGLGSSTVSQACRGALACALLSDGTYNASDDALIRYLAKHQQPSDFALYSDVYAEICGCGVECVKTALERGGELVPAMTLGDFQIRVTHPASIAFIAKFPFGGMDENHNRDISPLLQMTEREWLRIPCNPLQVVWKTRMDAWRAAP